MSDKGTNLRFGSSPVKPAGSITAKPVCRGRDTRIQVLVGPEEAPNFSLRRFIMQPGGGMPLHTNQVEHEQYVLRGSAQMRIGEQIYKVRAGDSIFVPAGVPHDYQAGQAGFEFICVVPNGPDRIELVGGEGA